MHFLLECSNFQKKASKLYGQNLAFYSPFADNNSTKVSYLYKLFMLLDLNNQDIYAINHEHTGISVKSSIGEHEYVSYLEYKYPNNKLVHAYSPLGQKRFKHGIPDCIDYDNKVIYYYNGCKWHQWAHNCSLFPDKKYYSEKSNKEKNKFDKKIENILLTLGGDYSVKIVWECHWMQQKKMTPN